MLSHGLARRCVREPVRWRPAARNRVSNRALRTRSARRCFKRFVDRRLPSRRRAWGRVEWGWKAGRRWKSSLEWPASARRTISIHVGSVARTRSTIDTRLDALPSARRRFARKVNGLPSAPRGAERCDVAPRACAAPSPCRQFEGRALGHLSQWIEMPFRALGHPSQWIEMPFRALESRSIER